VLEDIAFNRGPEMEMMKNEDWQKWRPLLWREKNLFWRLGIRQMLIPKRSTRRKKCNYRKSRAGTVVDEASFFGLVICFVCI